MKLESLITVNSPHEIGFWGGAKKLGYDFRSDRLGPTTHKLQKENQLGRNRRTENKSLRKYITTLNKIYNSGLYIGGTIERQKILKKRHLKNCLTSTRSYLMKTVWCWEISIHHVQTSELLGDTFTLIDDKLLECRLVLFTTKNKRSTAQSFSTGF